MNVRRIHRTLCIEELEPRIAPGVLGPQPLSSLDIHSPGPLRGPLLSSTMVHFRVYFRSQPLTFCV